MLNKGLWDIAVKVKGILNKFANDTKLGGVADTLRGKEALQGDVPKLEGWGITNQVKFNEGKSWILHLR